MALIEATRQRVRARLLLAALSCFGCSSRFVDIITRSDAPDPCAALEPSQCVADTQDGCSLQPNRTGCMPSDPSCGAGVCAGGDPFVVRRGEALFLRDVPYTFVGTVSWGLAWDDNGCQVSAYSSQEQALSAEFTELAAMHTSVLRFWAFQSYAGASGTDFSHFDRLVTAARAAGVRLMPVLENMHAKDCTADVVRDDAWFASGYKSPDGDYALSYRDYVAGLVAHFRDEPTIMAWELMHEASGNDFASLDTFAADMTKLVRASDPNHLIALGLNNGDTPATSTDGDPSNYSKLQNRAEIDLLDVHDFNAPDTALPTQAALCRSIAHALGKAIFVGAAAVKLSDTSSASFALRASLVASKIDAAKIDGFRGFLVYDYVPAWQNPTYDFDSRSGEPLAGPNGVLDQRAPRF